VQRAGGTRERRGLAAETEHLRVRAEHEEAAGEQRALQNCAGNGAQRIARFAAQRGCALKADKLKMESTNAGPSERNEIPLSWNWLVSS
jgi:hypothetical protein